MNDSEFVYKPQDVNYLGFLAAQLRDMTGVDTLAYELMQNADDVQHEDGRFPVTTLSDGHIGPVSSCLIAAPEAIFSQDQAARVPFSQSDDHAPTSDQPASSSTTAARSVFSMTA